MYLTSDLHFYHKGVLQFCPDTRPFADVDEMNQYLVDKWNEKAIKRGVKMYHLGVYNWKPENLNHNHSQCYDYAEFELLSGKSIIVSNTSTTNKEVNKYKKLAEKYGAKFVSIIVENRHNGKNIHNVPDEVLIKQSENIKNSLEV